MAPLDVGISDIGEEWSYPAEEQLLSLGEDLSNFSNRSTRDREDMKEIRNDQLDSIDSDYLDSEGESPTIPEKVYGSPDLQEKIREVLWDTGISFD